MSQDKAAAATPDPIAQLSDEEARILEPDYALKKLIGEEVDIKQIFSPENIEKAQKTINEQTGNFLVWVMKDIEALEQSYAKAAADPAASQAEIGKLAKTAFIVKSQAGTFGYQLATQIAKSLDDFCNQHFRPTPEHLMVVRKHIDALSAVFAKNLTGEGDIVGRELAGSLSKLIDKYK